MPGIIPIIAITVFIKIYKRTMSLYVHIFPYARKNWGRLDTKMLLVTMSGGVDAFQVFFCLPVFFLLTLH